MLEESVTYPPSGGYPLYLTAKRYWLPSFETNASDPAALTLLLLHATSFHKEIWMPTLDAIFSLASSEDSPVKIREAWCLDCPNHGASGQMNATVLLQPEFFRNFSCERFAQAVHHFLSVGPDQGASVDFRKRNLVGIGHSLGGVAITMLQAIEPAFTFSSLVLIEPLLSPGGSHHLRRLREILVKGAYERRDVWPDRRAGYAGARYPEGAYPGVTLACTREQEAAMYRDPDGATKAVETLKRICRTHPVHLILGGVADFVPARVHKAIIDLGPYASVTIIEDAGHLLVQEVPNRLGKGVFNALAMNVRLRSRL
ncbi:Alpha/beta hydrolase fold-1 [Mycena olivaceomarginata]|nr:Alpha/beta hydrolase fold-1 [Mycena olivaceomarginata]